MPSELLLRNLKGLTTVDLDLVLYDNQTLEFSLLQISGSEFINWILKTIVVGKDLGSNLPLMQTLLHSLVWLVSEQLLKIIVPQYLFLLIL